MTYIVDASVAVKWIAPEELRDRALLVLEDIRRLEDSLSDIRDYIETSPLRWHLDRANPANARFLSPVGAGLKPVPTQGIGSAP